MRNDKKKIHSPRHCEQIGSDIEDDENVPGKRYD